MSASSAQYKLEVDELEECLSDVVEVAERHLQDETFQEDSKDSSVDETDSGQTPMETDSVDKVISDKKSGNDTKSKANQDSSQVISESGTVRGIKGRVRQQIAASNQTEIMLHGFMKKQKSFTRTPLAVVHKSESDEQPTVNKRVSLIRTGSHEDLSTQEPKQIFKRSNSQRVKTIKQDESQEERKLKPRGRAPPPPQEKMKQKQLQQGDEDRSTVTITQVTETTFKQTEQPPHSPANQPDVEPVSETAATSGPEMVRKVPPKVKPKITRVKSKEAEDKVASSTTPVIAADTVAQSVKSHPAALSKRTKSESHIKAVSKQLSPNKDRKSSAATIESSNDGRQVLVLCPSPPPGSSKQDQPTSAVRIFLPPPPPTLPPCEEQESEENTEPTKSPKKDKTVKLVTTKQDQQLVGSDRYMTSQPSNTSKHALESQRPSAANEQDNTQAIEPLPHVVFDPSEDLPPTPPGTPHNELVSEETMLPGKDEEIVAPSNDDEILVPGNDDDIETVPPPPPMDDFSIDEDSLPPPVDFDPSLLPPPLPGNDDEFDEAYIVPPPPSTDDDSVITALTDMVPSFEAVDDILMSDDIPPESTPPWTPPISSEEPVDFEGDQGDIGVPNIPPADALENKEDKIEKLKMAENIMGTTDDMVVSDISEPPVESTEMQDELNNIIASLQTIMQDQAESDGEEVVDDSVLQTPPLSAWSQPPESPPKEPSPDESKNKAITQNVATSQDVVTSQDVITSQDIVTSQDVVTSQDTVTNQDVATTQDVTTTQAVNSQDSASKQEIDHGKEISSSVDAAKQETVTSKPTPVRAAPPPPPLPPVGKSTSKLPTSPTKAKSPPPTVKPKPKRPGSQASIEEFQDELAAKLRKRQTKDQGWEGNTTQTVPNTRAAQPSITQPKNITRKPIQTNVPKAQNSMQPSVPKAQANLVPPVQGAIPNMKVMGAGNVQGSQEQMEQIQMLQNQIQILQLQQQLQQLQQQQVAPGQTPNPVMTMPQLGVPGMQMPQIGMAMQIPQSGIGMQMPAGMQTGNGIQPGGTPLPTQMTSPPVGNVTSTLITTNNTSDTQSDSPPPLPTTSPPPLPTTSPPPLTDPNSSLDQLTHKTMSKAMSDSVLHQRPPSQILRSRAAGQYEDALDDILEEVREADHSAILRKVIFFCIQILLL